MILLPLLEHLLVGGTDAHSTQATSCVVARVVAANLCIELAIGGTTAAESSEVIRDLRLRLHALYGDRATLRLEAATRDGTLVIMEIPHETADGGHR
jgi:LytS/YehU family sensor histidine kinase